MIHYDAQCCNNFFISYDCIITKFLFDTGYWLNEWQGYDVDCLPPGVNSPFIPRDLDTADKNFLDEVFRVTHFAIEKINAEEVCSASLNIFCMGLFEELAAHFSFFVIALAIILMIICFNLIK